MSAWFLDSELLTCFSLESFELGELSYQLKPSKSTIFDIGTLKC